MGATLLLGAIWGGSFFFARIAVAELHPLVLVLFRVTIAAIALQLYLGLRGPSFRLASRMRGCSSCWRSPTMSSPSRLSSPARPTAPASPGAQLDAPFGLILANVLTSDEKLTWNKLAGIALA
jgi:drug/metabolite transporter (DMT)-like permease